MPINSLYPSFIKVFYSSNGHNHTMVIPCKYTVSASPPHMLLKKGGGSQDWESCLATDFIPLLAAVMNNASSFVSAELWKMASPTADPVFVAAKALAIAGASATAIVPYSQVSYTFRADDGGLFRLLLLEGIQAANLRDDPPYAAAPNLAISDYAIDDESFICARSGGYLVSPIRLLTKTNDKVREKFLLDT